LLYLKPKMMTFPKTNHQKTAYSTGCLAAGILVFFLILAEDQKTNALFADEPTGRQELLIPYEQRLNSVDEQQSVRMAKIQPVIPEGFQPWWNQYADRPLWESSHPLTIEVEALVLGAMKYSPKVLALSTIPEIQKTEIVVAEAAFDTHAFLESKFIRTSDPVGNELTVGGDATRFRDQNWSYGGGIRRKTEMGGQFEVAQHFGYEDNNSLFYLLLPQGTARMSISYTQPLLNGAGRAYNESVIVLAAIDANVATDQFAAELQQHLLELNKAYWTLYVERVALLQKRHLFYEAESILNELDARKHLDANKGQIVRAKAAMEARRGALIRLEAGVRNAEARINQLVSDPNLVSTDRIELIPVQQPNLQYPECRVRDSLITALHNRPEVNRVLEEIRAASVRQQVATKDLLPELDAVLATYVSGLEGQGAMGHAWIDQFSVGEPTYTAGLLFEMPLGNRAAKARLQKRNLECLQFSLQLRQTVAILVEDVENSVRDVNASFCEAQAQYLSMQAANTEIKYLEARWRLLPSEEQVAGIVLEDLLDAQDRCGNAEFNFVSAQAGYNIALANLNRATGLLLKCVSMSPPPQQMAPPKKGPEEIPLPPSQVITPDGGAQAAPLPLQYQITPSTVPPALTNISVPAAGKTPTNDAPATAQANMNRATLAAGKSQPGATRAGQGASPKGGVEAAPLPPPSQVVQPAPLPPVLTNGAAPAAGKTPANNTPATAQANMNRTTRTAGQSQPEPVRTGQSASPKTGVEAAPLPPPIRLVAPLPPVITNLPTTAAATAPTDTINR
jgi:outer membrane protein TolC